MVETKVDRNSSGNIHRLMIQEGCVQVCPECTALEQAQGEMGGETLYTHTHTHRLVSYTSLSLAWGVVSEHFHWSLYPGNSLAISISPWVSKALFGYVI